MNKQAGEVLTADAMKYEVLFDEPFIGGLQYGECSSNLYTMLPFTLMNFSYGTRLTQVPESSVSVSVLVRVSPFHFQFHLFGVTC